MGKFSSAKLIVALSIICLYVFIFGIVGTIDLSSQNGIEIYVSIPESTPEKTDKNDTTSQSTAAETTIKLLSMKKPGFSDYEGKEPVSSEEITLSSEDTTPPQDDVITPDDEITETTTTTQQAEPIETTITAETTTELPAETTLPDETTASTTEETEPPTNAGGETLFVYDQNTGTNVSGDAATIIARNVVGEISNFFDDEAVKAMAVAAYTHIKKANLAGEYPTVALNYSSNYITENITRCVNEVLGQAIYYDGSLIQCTYYASSASYSNSSYNVWGIDYPYLRSVKTDFENNDINPNYGNTKTYTSNEMKNMVRNTIGIELTGDPSKWLKVTSTLDNQKKNYVTGLTIGGKTTYVNSSGKTKTIDGRTMREVISSYGVKSAAFTVSYDKESDLFTFTTWGYGHGVGMSQWGAQILAKEKGYTYKEILQYYYTGVEVY